MIALSIRCLQSILHVTGVGLSRVRSKEIRDHLISHLDRKSFPSADISAQVGLSKLTSLEIIESSI